VKYFSRSHLCSIYLITHRVSGKTYVGQTWTTMMRRWRQHQSHPTCRKLFTAIKAHGVGAFKVELLTLAATQEMADHFEALFIDRYRSREDGYNLREAGAQGKLSLETRVRMGDAQRGKTISLAMREKLRAANLGKKHGPPSAETREKISAAQRGRKSSPEKRALLSKSHMGHVRSAESRAKQSETCKGKVLGGISTETRAKMVATRVSASAEVRFARGQKMWKTRRAHAALKVKT
jgi:group I intron endonuclease